MSRGAFLQREDPHLGRAVVPEDVATIGVGAEEATRHRVVMVAANPRLCLLPPDWSDRFPVGEPMATHRHINKGSN